MQSSQTRDSVRRQVAKQCVGEKGIMQLVCHAHALSHAIAHVRRVTEFLARGAHSDIQRKVGVLQCWPIRLRTQLASFLARLRTDVADLEENGAWMDARTIVTVFKKFRLKTLRQLPECTVSMAKQLHDACQWFLHPSFHHSLLNQQHQS